jgi:hypothetical protein
MFFTLPALTASANPLNYLKRAIKKDGYIIYRTPLAHSGTGTLVGGTPNSMSIVTDPQECFPDSIEGKPTNIRKTDETSLGSINQTSSFEGKVGVDLLKFMNTANGIFNIGLGVDVIQTVELSFEGAKMEYIDVIRLQDFYNNHMSPTCKSMLEHVGFIVQALKVDQMRFAFKNKSGGYLNLKTDGVSEYLNINLDVKYHIEQDYILVIDTPKYIGYQLGRLQEKDQGLSMYRASRTLFNRYLFKSISIFQQ